MSEIEQMLSKPKGDVEAIAVQFGVFTQEEAASKSKEEIVSALSGVPVEELTGKKNSKTTKSTKTSKTSSKKAVKEDAAVSEEKPAKAKSSKTSGTAKKTTKSVSKKTSEKAPVVEEKAEEKPSETVAPETPVSENEVKTPAKKAPAKKTTSKKTRKTSNKEVEAEPEAAATEAPALENAPETSAEEVKEDTPVAKKKPSKKKKPAKTEETPVNASSETAEVVVAEEKTDEVPSEDKPKQTKKPASKKKAPKKTIKTESEDKAEEVAASSSEENKDAEKTQAAPESETKIKGRKRRISFGPEQEIKQVEITDEPAATEEAAPEVPPQPVIPEIQYIEVEGILSITGESKNDFCGFVHRNNYLPGEEDAYVPGQIIRRLGLRRGDKIKGLAVPARGKDKYSPLKRVLAVNDREIPEDSDFEEIKRRKRFEHLTAIYPDERLTLETGAEDLSCRIIDLFSPIGKGQRGMIVSPPKAGKTILLQKVANAITANNPNCKVIVLLIDERPEEVTDMQRSIKGEVVYSTFDKRPENHVRVTELVLERAMRLVELGEDVVILLDSMTRLARAYNLTINPTGRTLSGGLDPGSLYGPNRFFGAARNIEDGGSLTIIATALIETGSRMDEVIFEEFKGTGNMEVVLDRKLADRRVYPAIAVDKSGTRREDLLLTPEELESVWLTRKAIAEVDTIAATEAVINYMKRTNSNSSFVLSAKKSFAVDS